MAMSIFDMPRFGKPLHPAAQAMNGPLFGDRLVPTFQEPEYRLGFVYTPPLGWMNEAEPFQGVTIDAVAEDVTDRRES